MQPRFIIQQKITAFVNKYKIYRADTDGKPAEMVAFAQQKRFNIKEKILFYSDESKQTPIFSFRAEKVFDVHGRYFVEDPDGALIGSFKKAFRKSLAVSTWTILDANGTEQYSVKENNLAVALFRRFSGAIPFVGDVLDIIFNFIRYHFVYVPVGGSEEVGRYLKTTLFRDHYRLELTDEVVQTVDWRVLVAMSVALDALQSR